MAANLSSYGWLNQDTGPSPMDAYQRAFQGAQQQRIQQESAAALREQRLSLAAERQAALDKARQDAEDRALADEAIRQGGGIKGATLAAALKMAPHAVPALTKFFDESDKSAAEINKLESELNDKRLDHNGLTANEVLTHGLDSLPTALAWHAEQFPKEAEQVQALGQKLQALPPEQQTAYLEQVRNSAPYWRARQAKNTPQVVGSGASLVDDTGTVLFSSPEKVTKPNSAQEYEYRKSLSPAERAAYDKYQTEDANRKRPQVTVTGAIAAETDPKAIAKGIMDGTMSPELSGYGRGVQGAVASELARAGYNHSGALTDWKATQKHVATMNGAQQLRLNQAINSLPDMLDSIDALAARWKGGRFPMLNKANLALAKGGALGKDAATIANQLDAQIADVVADLGNVYMGGNSPTDHALELAGKSLKAEWDEKVLRDMVGLARKNVTIRRNSINSTGVAGASPSNPYTPQPAAPKDAPSAGERVRVKGPNGESGTMPKGSSLPPGWSVVGG